MEQGSAKAQATTAQSEIANVPTTWPGAFGLYKYSKKAIKRNWQTVLVFVLANFALGAIDNALVKSTSMGLIPVVTLLVEIVVIVISMALTFTYLACVRGQEITVEEALRKCKPILFLKLIASAFMGALILGVSLILLVVPFFFVLPRLTLISYFLLDKNMGPIEAIKASWHATQGHALKVWCVILATIAMALLCLTIIGIPFSLYFLFMYGASMALVYEFVSRNQHPNHA